MNNLFIESALNCGFTKKSIANKLNTSTRTLGRWRDKSNYEYIMYLDDYIDGNVGYHIDQEHDYISFSGLVCPNVITTGDLADGVIIVNDLIIDDKTVTNLEKVYVSAMNNIMHVNKTVYVGFIVSDNLITKTKNSFDILTLDKNKIELDKIELRGDFNWSNGLYSKSFRTNATKIVSVNPSLNDIEEVGLYTLTEQPKDYIDWNMSSKFVNITRNTETFSIDNNHKDFKEVGSLCLDGEFNKAIELISKRDAIKTYINGDIKIIGNALYYKDHIIQNSLTTRIVDDMIKGEDFNKYVLFMQNMMLNPSNHTINRLYDFLEANDIKITDDGYFVAWKAVNLDYTDCYTGNIDNSISTVVKMDRNLVNDDDHETCSHGLHVCSYSYVSLYDVNTKRILFVKVHPKDVVSIPVDYNNAKMRCCEYKVIGEQHTTKKED